jgi:hypothetical protein
MTTVSDAMAAGLCDECDILREQVERLKAENAELRAYAMTEHDDAKKCRMEMNRLKAENVALQADAALGRAVEAMPMGRMLGHFDWPVDWSWDVTEWKTYNPPMFRRVGAGSTAMEALEKAVKDAQKSD